VTTEAVRLRPYRREDASRLVEIGDRNFPERWGSLESFLYHDDRWDEGRYFRFRLMAETAEGTVAGWGEVMQVPWQFYPGSYALELAVDPAYQRRGIGSALYEGLIGELAGRGARLVRAVARESKPESLAFLEHRGFREVQRYWESRLDVDGVDLARFAGAEERATGQGIELTTLAEERAGRPEADLLREVYELEAACLRDVPAPDPVTPGTYGDFVRHEIEAPGVLPEAWFLARTSDRTSDRATEPGGSGRYVGLSVLSRRLSEPGVLDQQLTGVLADYRGRGIAMALKLRGLRYAREHGYREIRTGNNTRNLPMLRINEALGFVKQPVEIELEKRLEAEGLAAGSAADGSV
jgi:ribosomal protein S18 acetylase RimI-like enzyme